MFILIKVKFLQKKILHLLLRKANRIFEEIIPVNYVIKLKGKTISKVNIYFILPNCFLFILSKT